MQNFRTCAQKGAGNFTDWLKLPLSTAIKIHDDDRNKFCRNPNDEFRILQMDFIAPRNRRAKFGISARRRSSPALSAAISLRCAWQGERHRSSCGGTLLKLHVDEESTTGPTFQEKMQEINQSTNPQPQRR
jgi:hypothetical protein